MTSVPETQKPYGYYQGPRVNPWLIRLPVLLVSGAILLVLTLTIVAGGFLLRYHDKIVPGVSADGVSLGGMTTDQAMAALKQHFTYSDDAVFTFRDGDHFWQATAGELGVSFQAQETVAEAFALAHSGNPMLDSVDQLLTWLNGHTIDPLVRYDQNAAMQRLGQIAAEINRPPVNATLNIQGTTVTATAGSSGRTLDVTATLSRLDDAILNLSNGGEIPLVVNETPPTIWDAQAAARKAQVALSGPLTLVADDGNGAALGPWTATVDQIAALLQTTLVDNGDGTQSYDVSVDTSAFQTYLGTLAAGLIAIPQDARFHFNVDSQQLEVIQPSVSGRSLNIPKTLSRMQQAVFSPDNRVVAMAFDYTQPQYPDSITAAELGITQMVSQATTYYTGSTQARRENIALAASRFDGIVIAPGEEFSYNKYLGDVSPEQGFVEGLVIVGGRTIRGVGGGVCQVSTTVFQAAFYAGYPILERYPHGYRVGYYEQGEGVGMDAAIYNPDLDFRFLNDTPYHLLIETSVYPGSDSVQFRFYSTNPGRQVVKQGPVITGVVPAPPPQYEVNNDLLAGQSQQVDWAADGADVTVTRIILDTNGNELRRDTFFSHYLPWQAIIQVAPGDSRLSSGG